MSECAACSTAVLMARMTHGGLHQRRMKHEPVALTAIQHFPVCEPHTAGALSMRAHAVLLHVRCRRANVVRALQQASSRWQQCCGCAHLRMHAVMMLPKRRTRTCALAGAFSMRAHGNLSHMCCRADAVCRLQHVSSRWQQLCGEGHARMHAVI